MFKDSKGNMVSSYYKIQKDGKNVYYEVIVDGYARRYTGKVIKKDEVAYNIASLASGYYHRVGDEFREYEMINTYALSPISKVKYLKGKAGEIIDNETFGTVVRVASPILFTAGLAVVAHFVNAKESESDKILLVDEFGNKYGYVEFDEDGNQKEFVKNPMYPD